MQKNCIPSIFTKTDTKLCLSLHYNGANRYLFLNGTKIHQFRAKDSEIVANPLCPGKTGLNEYVYDISVDYDAIAVDDMLGIHKYVMEKKI